MIKFKTVSNEPVSIEAPFVQVYVKDGRFFVSLEVDRKTWQRLFWEHNDYVFDKNSKRPIGGSRPK